MRYQISFLFWSDRMLRETEGKIRTKSAYSFCSYFLHLLSLSIPLHSFPFPLLSATCPLTNLHNQILAKPFLQHHSLGISHTCPSYSSQYKITVCPSTLALFDRRQATSIYRVSLKLLDIFMVLFLSLIAHSCFCLRLTVRVSIRGEVKKKTRVFVVSRSTV